MSWVRAYFWSIVCYHSCILNSYSKFKERETQFLSFSLFSLSFLRNFFLLLFSPSITIISLSPFLFHFSFLISSVIYLCVLIFSFFFSVSFRISLVLMCLIFISTLLNARSRQKKNKEALNLCI